MVFNLLIQNRLGPAAKIALSARTVTSSGVAGARPQKREAKSKPSKTWAEMMAFSNSIIGPLGIDGFVTYPTEEQAKAVASWLEAVASGDLENLPEVLDQYIAGIALKPVLSFENKHVQLVPTMFRAAPIQLAALGTALLIDPEREWHSRFGQCGGCHKFFLDMRNGRGPKRQKWCPGSNKCKDAEKYLRRKVKAGGEAKTATIPPSTALA